MRDPIVALFGALVLGLSLLAWIAAEHHAATGTWF